MTISYVDEQPVQEPRRKSCRSSMRRRGKKSAEESGAVDNGVRCFTGDGLVVRIHSNHRALKITGDGCHVVLSKNSGSVHIVGDGCQLSVSHNVGDIEYTGDGGRVRLGPNSCKEKVVKFVGDGGKVIFDSGCEAEPIIEFQKMLCQPSDLKRTTKNQRSGRSRTRGSVCSCERVFEKRPSCEKCEGRRDNKDYRVVTVSSSDQESQDNTLNSIMEGRNRGKYGGRNDEIRKSTRQRTVTMKVITEIQSDGRCVRKRFSDSSLIVNSINDSRPKRVVPRTSDMDAGDRMT